jgi:hypothetical protein
MEIFIELAVSIVQRKRRGKFREIFQKLARSTEMRGKVVGVMYLEKSTK